MPAAAAPRALDCPLRDAPFSLDMPLIDILASDRARAVLETHAPGALKRIPPMLAKPEAPSFGAIITGREALALTAGKGANTVTIERDLRALSVTESDRAARCARYDNERPEFRLAPGRPRVLLFEKVNGFRDGPSMDAARKMFRELAEKNGWSLTVTDKGGAMHRQILRKFDVVIWNNVSGDVLSLTQRSEFRRYIEEGGAFIGVHGSAGDPAYFWDWYVDTLIGARFIGHPMTPQFQDARIRVEEHPGAISRGLPGEWTMKDEWYSFAVSPRSTGAHIVATLDENSYRPGNGPSGNSLAMGKDHPIAWTRCVGRGRSFYSAIGHRPDAYANGDHRRLIEQAVRWVTSSTQACR